MVEDNPDDQELARLAIERVDEPCELLILDDGLEALDYLKKTSPVMGDEALQRPDILLVDLAMPRMDGLTLLRAIRSEPTWRRLPVVVFTTSSADRDVTACYDNGCNSYIVKPYSMRELAYVLTDLIAYWFGRVKLPG